MGIINNADISACKIECGCEVFSRHSLHVFTVYDVLYTGPGIISYLILDYPGPHGGRARVLPDGYSFYARGEYKKIDICAKAELLSCSSDTSTASEEMKKLSVEWKSSSRVLREDMLETRFYAAKSKLFEKIRCVFS